MGWVVMLVGCGGCVGLVLWGWSLLAVIIYGGRIYWFNMVVGGWVCAMLGVDSAF